MNSSVQNQQSIFDDMWLKFSQQVTNDKGFVDFPEKQDLKPQHKTTVVRLPASIAISCNNEWSELFKNDYHYPVDDIHFTLLNLDKLLAGHNIDVTQVSQLMSGLQSVLSDLPPIELKLKGFNLFPTTVYVQIFDINGVAELYRHAIKAHVMEQLGISSNNSEALVKDIVSANIVRFREKPTNKVVHYVKGKRGVNLGNFTVTEFEFVTTDKLLSKPNTIIHSVVELNAK